MRGMFHRTASPGFGPVSLGLALAAGVGGMAWQMQQARLMPLWLDGLVLLMGIAVGVWGLRGPFGPGQAWLARAAVLVGVALLAWAQTDGRAHVRLGGEHAGRSGATPPRWEGCERWVIGRVADLPALGAAGMRWRFEIEAPSAHKPAACTTAGSMHPGPAPDLPRDVLVFASAAREGVVGGAALPALRVGERWALKLSLRRPNGLANPGGFDAEQWLFTLGVQAQGSWRGEARWLGEAPPAWQRPDWALGRLRQAIRERLLNRVADHPAEAAVLVALLVGDQSGIEDATWEVLRRTGISHLVSVSGLHVTMFAWLAQGLVGWLWRRQATWMVRVPTPTAARWGGLALAAAYAGLAGWAIPAQRTVWMLAVAVVLRTRACDWPGWLVWLAAGGVVLLAEPWALLQASFWLSFVAVGLLMLSDTEADPRGHDERLHPNPIPVLADPRQSGPWCRQARLVVRLLGQAVRSQGVATWGLAPLSLWFFQSLSMAGLVVNLMAIPLFSFVITPLVLLGALGDGASVAWDVAARILAVWMAALHAVAAWPGAVWVQAPVPLGVLLVGIAGVALSVTPLPAAWRLGGCLCVLPVLWPPSQVPRWGQMAVTVVDVGQGSAVIVRTRGHTLLFDAGPALGPVADAGQRVITPLLHQMGVQRLDRLVLSHGDQDHVGGAASLMGAWPVGEVLSPLLPNHTLHRQATARADAGHQPCHRGLTWVWSGVTFTVLHPEQGQFDDRPGRGTTVAAASSNARSCVLRVEDAQGHALLMTGDIEAAQEADLVARMDPALLRADALVAPHHGSLSSSSELFLDAVKPRLVWVQSGFLNRYGHPHATVLERHASRGIRVLNTVDCGAWQGLGAELAKDADPGRWRQGCQRVQRVRYWQRRSALVDDDT